MAKVKQITVDVHSTYAPPKKTMPEKIGAAAGYLTFLAFVIFLVCLLLKAGAAVLTM